MIKRGLRGRAVALSAAIAAVLLAALALSPAARADTTRTLNLSFYCDTGLPYGLLVDTYNGSAWSGWYSPPGSSYAAGTTKYYSVSISSSAVLLEFQPTYCDNEPSDAGYNYMWEGDDYGLSAGTSTINATGGRCADYTYSVGYGVEYPFYVCTIGSLTYS
jgi:hypothetical protein